MILYYCCFDFCRSGAQQVCHHLVCVFCPVARFVLSLLLSRARICVRCHGEGRARMFVLLMKTNERENKTEKAAHTHAHTPVHYRQKKELRRKISSRDLHMCILCLSHRQAHIIRKHYVGKYAHRPSHTQSSDNSVCVCTQMSY